MVLAWLKKISLTAPRDIKNKSSNPITRHSTELGVQKCLFSLHREVSCQRDLGEASFTRINVDKYDVFTAFRIHVFVLWSPLKLRQHVRPKRRY